jgi:prolyl-tRNA synthetase
VPLRLELGPRDLADEKVMMVSRHDRNKQPVGFAEVAVAAQTELDRIQQDLYDRAFKRREEATVNIDTWDDFTALYQGDGGFALCHWCGEGECEQTIQDKTKVTIRNIPSERDETPGECVHCGNPSHGRVLFAQGY